MFSACFLKSCYKGAVNKKKKKDQHVPEPTVKKNLRNHKRKGLL